MIATSILASECLKSFWETVPFSNPYRSISLLQSWFVVLKMASLDATRNLIAWKISLELLSNQL
jgi:hypothetical protein